jgi:hypothetical protein
MRNARQPREESLQDRYFSEGSCFGCGPRNDRGLRIKSRVAGDEVVADWTPGAHHEAYPGVLNGGIIGALLDCHSNWAAAHHLMEKAGAESPPCTVTAEFSVMDEAAMAAKFALTEAWSS